MGNGGPNDLEKKLSLRGKFDKESVLEAEIIRGRRSASHYNKLSKGMNFMQIQSMAEKAVEAENMPAIQGLAMTNKAATALSLSSNEGFQLLARKTASGDNNAPNLFFISSRSRTSRAFRWWEIILAQTDDEFEIAMLRQHTRMERPLGTESFVKRLERITRRVLRKLPVGRPRKNK